MRAPSLRRRARAPPRRRGSPGSACAPPPRCGRRAAAGLRRARIDDAPFALGDDRDRGVVGLLRRRVGDDQRLDVGIGRALLLGGVEAGIGDRVGVARAQPRDRLEARRIDRIGGDVVDRRQPVGLDAEIGRIGDQRDADEQRGQRLAAGRRCPPSRSRRRRRGEQDRDARRAPARRRTSRAPARSRACPSAR